MNGVTAESAARLSGLWGSLHVFYAGNLDRLLRESVIPNMQRLATGGQIDKWFFIRYWLKGTHLRVRFLPRSRALKDVVTRRLAEEFTGWLAANPSEDHLDWTRREENGRTYLDAFRFEYGTGRGNGAEAFDSGLSPNNSVIESRYYPEVDRYGGGRGMEVCLDHFHSSSRFVERIICDYGEVKLGFRSAIAAAAVSTSICAFVDDNDNRIRFSKRYRDYWAGYATPVTTRNESVQAIFSAVRDGRAPKPVAPVLEEYRAACVETKARLLVAVPGEGAREGVYASLIHMTNNRLGLPPSLEASLAHQLTLNLTDK